MNKYEIEEFKRNELLNNGFTNFMNFTISEECDTLTMETKIKWISLAMAPFANKDQFAMAPNEIIDGSSIITLMQLLLKTSVSQPTLEDIAFVESEVTKRLSHSITRPILFKMIWASDSIFHNAYQMRLYELYQNDADFHERTIGYVSSWFITANFTPQYLATVSLKYLKVYTITALTNNTSLDLSLVKDPVKIALFKFLLKTLPCRSWLGQYMRSDTSRVFDIVRSYEHLFNKESVDVIITTTEKGGCHYFSYKDSDAVNRLREYILGVSFRRQNSAISQDVIDEINRRLYEACDSIYEQEVCNMHLVFIKRNGIMKFIR